MTNSANLTNLLDKVISWGLVVLVFLVPLFFLPVTSNFYEFNKNILLLLGTGLLLLAWVGKMVLQQKITFKHTAFDLPILALALVFSASTLLAAANKWATLWSPQATGTIWGLTALYFLITNNLTAKTVTRLLAGITIPGVILTLLALATFTGLGEKLFPAGGSLAWLGSKTFTPAGNLVALATFLAVLLVINLTRVYADRKANNRGLPLALNLLAGLVIAVGFGVTLYQLIAVIKPILLPYSISWAIAIEAFKNYPLLGVGPDSFLEAFSRFRPVVFNSLPIWANRFGAASNWYFQLLTVVGILGLIPVVWLALGVLKNKVAPHILLPLLLIFLILGFLPANFLLLFLLWILLAVLALNLPTKEYAESGRILAGIFLVVVIVIVGAGVWLGVKTYRAEIYFYQSLQALAQNKGTETYNLQIKAITDNPQADLYHLAYSQTNLALANALASQTNLTEQNKQDVSQLVQQAIQEAKTAVTLNPRLITNWENLAQIYRGLINFAQGADQWTVAAYQQALSLDPLNPSLRLGLGGVYYSLANYDQATRLFEQAVDLKPDFPNAHYNLASALREKKDYAQALAQMEVVLTLVDPSSGDFQKATEEANQLREKVKETQPAAAKTPETLVTPAPIPSQAIEPPIQLPESSSPTINP
ncbi:hypothetical protein COT65_02465 [Candidatus Shapirobacteria bacterium CG09_land_8_20_14_0_10_47_13]|uniref:Uncharacterized protein n=1 Tax=Candidatus Shapirobacteria bacterium CG09_land_8_20_14_0_10_47_13 TaxID=1974481 RepID=A0A2H0WM67_9BACT|nr:MAG: hypothetical protein COT65_02465 [Candidatus Shapirobacteria bacterium CG09_land_8_20_14_0_10_47_13]